MRRSKIVLAVAATTTMLLLAGCASNKSTEPEAKELKGSVKIEVLEHKGTALGINELPTWVETYVQKGITGLEKISDYTEDYCFVAETTAQNLDAAQAWVDGFDMPQTIARNVSQRVEATFTGAASGSPDGAYGAYFENVVKASSEITYSGARKVNDWWVLVRRYDADDAKTSTDEFRVYTLYTLKEDLLDKQVLDVIDDIAKASDLTENQSAEIDKVKNLIKNSGLSD